MGIKLVITNVTGLRYTCSVMSDVTYDQDVEFRINGRLIRRNYSHFYRGFRMEYRPFTPSTTMMDTFTTINYINRSIKENARHASI